MKLGLVTAILEQYDYEKMIDTVSEMGFSCVEVACWPSGKAERRYAGVSHIDVARVCEDDAYAKHVLDYAASHHVAISSLAFYPNTMDGDLEKRQANVAHLMTVIRASAKLGVNMVTTFIGRDQWPGGQNLMTTPPIWHKVFDILPSDNLGINYDPSHFVWQMIDYLKPLYEFKDKIFHVHYKDIKMFPDKLERVGVMAYPLDFMCPKLPGLGDVDWGKFVSALTDIGYDGFTCIEVEDKSFEGSEEAVLNSLRLSKRYLEQFVI